MELFGIGFQIIPCLYAMIQRLARAKLKDLSVKYKAVAVSVSAPFFRTPFVSLSINGKILQVNNLQDFNSRIGGYQEIITER
jgi:hypothetical protein